MLWVVWQCAHVQGSAMRPRSISTRVVWAHTWHWKKASCISGISCDVLMTMPLMVMSWSMSVKGKRFDCPPVTLSLPSAHPYLGLPPRQTLDSKRIVDDQWRDSIHCKQEWTDGWNLRTSLGYPSYVQPSFLSTPAYFWTLLSFYFLFTYFIYNVCLWTYVCHGASVEMRRHLWESVLSLLCRS